MVVKSTFFILTLFDFVSIQKGKINGVKLLINPDIGMHVYAAAIFSPSIK
jgi:hypothetical protein